MDKKLNIKQLCVETLSFMAKNVVPLALFGLVSFLASFLSFKYVFGHQTSMLFFYSLFCYFFYYVFISLYFEQKPIFTSEKLVSSAIKAIVIFAISLFVVICFHFALKLLKYMAMGLVGFPDVYDMLKNTYHFLNSSMLGRLLLSAPLIFLLTFTFFIPGFAWVSVINGSDSSLWSAFSKTQGNYLKIFWLLFCLFALLPFVLSFVVPSKPVCLGLSNALTNMLELVFYIRLYDFFYKG